MSVTEMYTKLVNAESALQKSKDENKRLQAYLGQILNEIEEKSPIIEVRCFLFPPGDAELSPSLGVTILGVVCCPNAGATTRVRAVGGFTFTIAKQIAKGAG